MAAGQLVCGAAVRDISPAETVGVFMAGFAPGRTSKGALEPLEAGAVYLSDGNSEICLISVDAIGLLQPVVRRIRAAVTSYEDSRRVIVCSTHTHAGPDTLGLWGPSILKLIPRKSGVDPAYIDHLVTQVAAAADAAKAAATPVTARMATFEVAESWTRNDRKGGGRYDTATALAFDALRGGAPVVTLLNFASHPEGLWEKNRMLSPDFPGAFRRRIRQARGGEAVYFSGPLGAMLTPNVPPKSSDDERQAYIETLGIHLADETIAALQSAEPADAPSLTTQLEPLRLTNANWRFRWAHKLGLVQQEYAGPNEIQTEVNHVALGDLEILTAPGEAAPEVGHQIRAKMGAPHRMIFCLAGDELGYILQPDQWDDREYKYETTMSLGRGTAEALLSAYDDLVAAS